MMSLVNDNNVQQVTSFMQEQLNNALDWSERHQLRSWLSALLCGFIVSLFHYAIVYFDSAVPGVSPPTPFSPRSK
ncbi:CG8321, partial [Drosophila busckii]